MKRTIILILIIGLNHSISMVFAQKNNHSEIKWDNWGIPHITGKTDSEVFYGFGWAQMKAHGNLILRSFGKSRGLSSEYWGGQENIENDRLVWKLDIPNRAQQWFNLQTEETKTILASFVKGMNDYCKENPEHIDEALKVVLPILPTDPLAKLQVSYHLKVGAFSFQLQAKSWKNAGSNAWAISPQSSENGNSLLLMQPHPPWFEDYLFFEAHLKSKDLNVYGITMPGSPTIAMGFNDHLGWGLTFNQADAMDLVELQVKDDHYWVDGEWKPFEKKSTTLKIKEGEAFEEEVVTIMESEYGFVVEEKDGKALALRISGFNRPFFIDQFIKMAKSKNLGQFEKAMKMLQLPLQNVVYADKHGDIFYLYNGIIPKRPDGTLADWSKIIPASKKGSMVQEYVSYQQLPKIKNPESGFVANSNNSPWSSTFPFVKPPADYPMYIAPKEKENFDLRSARSIKMIKSKPKLSFEDLVEMQSSTYSELASRTVDELIEYGKKSDNDLLEQAAGVLQNWDRQLNHESKGAVLFDNWFNVSRFDLFAKEFSLDDALNTPNTLKTSAKEKLLEAANVTKSKYGKLDVAWGEVYKINYAQKSLGSSLGLNELGCFNAGFYRPMSATEFTLLGGSAYTSVVEFGKKIRAKGILSYGNSSQTGSPFHGDQLQLLSDGKLRDIWFYDKDIDRNIYLKESLRF